MCDTMIALSGSTCDGSVLFAKNSDREPNEPHIIVRSPRRKLESGEKHKCTYIGIEAEKDLDETYEAFLFKPDWIWGAEMGVNEKGVVIGNEAVFTRERIEDKSLLGMDILRLALEMCSDAEEALDYIIYIIEKYGQGGKAGYRENLRYHNSYIIADFKEAFVLETAGRHWIYKKVEDVYSISNSLTIEDDYEKCSSSLVENAINRGWYRSKEGFNFKKAYESRLHPKFTKGDTRQNHTCRFLKDKAGSICFEDMKAVLRSHCGKEDIGNFISGSMGSVCMHAGGGLVNSQTTGSLIVQLKEGRINIWATGSSLPCIAVFKPFWFSSDDLGFLESDQARLVEYWREIEVFHRMVLDGRITELEEYLGNRNKLESELVKLSQEAKTDEERAKATEYAFGSEKKLVMEALKMDSCNGVNSHKRGVFYKWYWKQQNKRL